MPFFEIQSIFLCPSADAVFVNGRTDIDFNLCEHGVSIKIEGGAVTFDYGTDFLDLLTGE